MIKRMESDNIRISLIAHGQTEQTAYDVVLTIKGEDHQLSVDELQEIVKVGQHFWDVNNLYQQTSEAIADRERWKNEQQLHPVGSVTGSKLGALGHNWN